nr:DUF427 domain-containing protein [Paracoccus yeei]
MVVDGNHYFPPHSVDRQYLEPSEHTSVCPVKERRLRESEQPG